jgi:hypothetical protein
MPQTAVSICSNALLLLGDNPISSFDDSSDRARMASNLFEPARDYVLRRHPWNCAIKRVTLSPDATAPAFDWGYQFTLPADFLKVLSIGERDAEGEFRIEGRKLLCDDNPLLLRYVFKNDNVGSWDPGLVWAMTSVMKALFAYPITQSTTMEQVVESVLRDVLRVTRGVDGQDDTPETLGDNPLLASRFIGSSAWSTKRG